jgi:hypothetical protein
MQSSKKSSRGPKVLLSVQWAGQMDLKDVNIWAIVAYVLPGLLIVESRSLAARTEFVANNKETWVNFLIWTVLYDLVLWSLGFALQTPSSVSGLEPALLVRLFVFVPIAIGTIYGLLERYLVVQRILRQFGINPASPIRAVWLEIIPKIRVGTYLIVILKDGTVYNTLVTNDSRFSSNPNNPDLYLGQTYSANWTPSNPQRAVYIVGSEIQSIEIVSVN